MTLEEQLARAATSIVHQGLAADFLALAPLFDALTIADSTAELVEDLRARFTSALGDDAARALTGADVAEIVRRGERLLAMVAAFDVLADSKR
jgi:hypothetical protein